MSDQVNLAAAAAAQAKLDSLLEVAKPVVKWLNDNANPHATVIIDTGHVELLSGEMGAPVEEFWRD